MGNLESNRKSRTRVELVRVARQMFAECGYSETTHADLAAAAKIGRTTFYEYFDSKEDLLARLVEEAMSPLNDDLLEGLDGLANRDKLAALVVRMIEFVALDPLGLILHTEVPRLPEETQRRVAAAHAPLSTTFVDVYSDGVDAGDFVAMAPQLAGHLMYECIMAAGRVLKQSEDPKQEVQQIAEAACGFVMRGLAVG